MADLWLAPASRHRCGAGAGDGARADRRKASTTGPSSSARATASMSWPRAPRKYPPVVAEANHAACRRATSSPLLACTPTALRPSSAVTASTPSAPACRRSAPITASWRYQATSTAPAATCACGRPRVSATTPICCTCREFRLDAAIEAKTHRRRPLPAVGRAAGLADCLPQPHRHRRHAHGAPLSRARALRQRSQHPRHLSQHAPHHRGAALARLRGGGRSRHDADCRACRHRAAQDDDARGGRGLLHAVGPDGALHPRGRSVRRARRVPRSILSPHSSTGWQSVKRSRSDLLPWRSQREFNTYILGDSGIRIEDLERTGYHQLDSDPRTAQAVRDADRQDRAVLDRDGEGRPRPVAGLHAAGTRAPVGRRRQAGFPSSSSPATARRATTTPASAISPGRPRSRPIRDCRCIPIRRAIWASKTAPGSTSRSQAARVLPAAHQAVRRDAARSGQHRHGLVAAIRSLSRARRARRQHQCRARLRRPLGSRVRFFRHPRTALPRLANLDLIARRECNDGLCARIDGWP